MALPNQINAQVPAGSDLPSTLDNRLRNLALATEDILGIPDQTNISNAGFLFASDGLSSIAFQNTARTPSTNGHLQRNAAELAYYDGTSSYNLVLDSRTGTLSNKTLVNATLNSPTFSGTVSTLTLDSPTINTILSGNAIPLTQELRLSTSTFPVMITDSLSVTTVYLTPYQGDHIALYDGTTIDTVSTGNASISLAIPGAASQL